MRQLQHFYTDVSNWSEPYSNGVFPDDYLGSLGAQPETPGAGAPSSQAAETPAQVTPATPAVPVPEVTIYGQCDFTAGLYVEQVQKMLVESGTLSPELALTEKGEFGDATCAAWAKKYGRMPSAADLVATLGPNVSCATILVPGCAAEAHTESGWTPAKLLLYGVGLVGTLVVARAIGRKKR
jgi:hypothetical protein